MTLTLDRLEALSVLTNPLIKEVFKVILRSKLVSRYELEITEKVRPDQLQAALDQLLGAGLINWRSAESRELDKFYPTGTGLSIEKMVA
jgi:hypothetical protein